MAFKNKDTKSEKEQYRENRKKEQAKNAKKSLSGKTKKIIAIVAAVAIVCGGLTAYVATGAIQGGPLSFFEVYQKTTTGAVITDKDGKQTKVTPAQYNYYFATIYNNLYSTVSAYQQYGLDLEESGYNVNFKKSFAKQMKKTDDGKEITWAEYLHDQTMDQIQQVNAYYSEAVAENDGKEPELTDEEQKKIDDAIASYSEKATEYGYTTDAFLKKSLGRGVNEKLVREEMKKSTIASNYSAKASETISDKNLTEAEINTYYENHIEDYQYTDFKIFEAADKDTAKKMLKDLNADGSNFAEAASYYAEDDFYREAYLNASKSIEIYMTKSATKSKYNLSADAMAWLFSADRQANDSATYDNFVLFVTKPLYTSNISQVNIRHILIAPETETEGDDATKANAAQWQAAKDKADALLAEWNKSAKTEDVFGEMAKNNSKDTGSAPNGGLIKDVYPGQMVNEFSNWCFDSSRKAGEVGVVKTDFGYHLIYFISVNAEPYWQVSVKSDITSKGKTEYLKEIVDTYKMDTKWFGSKFFETDKYFG